MKHIVARRAVTAAVSLLAVVLLAGCTDFKAGPAGLVVDKDRTYQPSTKTQRYDLTVRTKDGSVHAFRVSSGDYDHCQRGSAYPSCTNRKKH
ncbi:hypothetical protein [Streptomyces sp. H27-D2]|uniref:hypothetical protein n=1 Tax=Streptomyces sp. H27-D2 TaxID=3046304 RepID=UPI002DB8C978|nr:hypothetical protein [Streptomyces sp. H27-D2]MEC4018868.1 hypothetical protein [Streptomyces sp. H27-D2]